MWSFYTTSNVYFIKLFKKIAIRSGNYRSKLYRTYVSQQNYFTIARAWLNPVLLFRHDNSLGITNELHNTVCLAWITIPVGFK
jgi:hypothetical protein